MENEEISSKSFMCSCNDFEAAELAAKLVSLPYKQRTFIICDNDVTLSLTQKVLAQPVLFRLG